jgi:hypothetical protein
MMKYRRLVASLAAITSVALIAVLASLFASGQPVVGQDAPPVRVELWHVRVEGSIEACTEFVQQCRTPFEGALQDLIEGAAKRAKAATVETLLTVAYTIPMDTSVHSLILAEQDTIQVDFKPTTVIGAGKMLQFGYERIRRETNESLGKTRLQIELNKGAAWMVSNVVSDTTFRLPDGTSVRRPSATLMLLAGYEVQKKREVF